MYIAIIQSTWTERYNLRCKSVLYHPQCEVSSHNNMGVGGTESWLLINLATVFGLQCWNKYKIFLNYALLLPKCRRQAPCQGEIYRANHQHQLFFSFILSVPVALLYTECLEKLNKSLCHTKHPVHWVDIFIQIPAMYACESLHSYTETNWLSQMPSWHFAELALKKTKEKSYSCLKK